MGHPACPPPHGPGVERGEEDHDRGDGGEHGGDDQLAVVVVVPDHRDHCSSQQTGSSVSVNYAIEADQ